MIEFEDAQMEQLAMDGLLVPVFRLTDEGLPSVDIKVGEQQYHYDRSYPNKGFSAVLPQYLREQLAAGKKAVLLERPDRLYVYLS